VGARRRDNRTPAGFLVGYALVYWGKLEAEMADELVAGVDCSTQGTKVLVADAATGRIVAEGRALHVVGGSDGARESDPDGWWTALREALAATGLAGSIRAISIAGQQHGLVVLDGHGRALRPAILWNDTRSAQDAERLVEALGGAGSPPESGPAAASGPRPESAPGSPPESGPEAWARRIGSVPVASFTVSKWAWLRRTSPDVAAATRAIRLPHD